MKGHGSISRVLFNNVRKLVLIITVQIIDVWFLNCFCKAHFSRHADRRRNWFGEPVGNVLGPSSVDSQQPCLATSKPSPACSRFSYSAYITICLLVYVSIMTWFYSTLSTFSKHWLCLNSRSAYFGVQEEFLIGGLSHETWVLQSETLLKDSEVCRPCCNHRP